MCSRMPQLSQMATVGGKLKLLNTPLCSHSCVCVWHPPAISMLSISGLGICIKDKRLILTFSGKRRTAERFVKVAIFYKNTLVFSFTYTRVVN